MKIIFISGLCVFFVFLIFILRKTRVLKKNNAQQTPSIKDLPSLVEDFSGDNRWDTELDLAKAYLELHQPEKAKHLLKSVITHGEPHQILEARKMFTALLKQERHS